ncbi:MAG TPA: hypothetical protein VJU86_13670 [Pyrinomonadaceae bacterium]|nr:hypothetical protein [Pyrinomonadaceae bacterium]
MAFAALIIAIISLISTVVLGTKNYSKSKRHEFFQRRDHCFQAISNFNAKNSETRLSGARFTTIATEKASTAVPQKYEELNKTLIVNIRTLATNIQSQAEEWDNQIERLHKLCAGYTSVKDAENIEEVIAIAQLSSDQIKRINEIYLSTLHILETTNPKMETDLAEMRKMELQLAAVKLESKELNEKAPAKGLY